MQWYPGQSDRLTGAWVLRKNAQKFEWKSCSKITRSNSMVKSSHGKDAVSDIFYLEAGWVEVQLLLQKDQKRKNWKGEKEINKTQKAY